ncbi:uncharacterized protein M421DRAFT_278242 [Didymella exigua CBS 183.55]|uniref:Uncharacterized protein n=1 Tax=Didymella exigua CBS 183.55 TaxID=1150837 RepID=A0A6A5RG76_9PLEO|nr:uncharacterized protein M421DRAFT_278242 [Didymella exigua CBS 183.55]KAF1924627.1 hypothetical protein M421DRAFT_278242 [Didymella exigua CBS 183.55]
MQRQSSSRDAAKQDATTKPRHPLSITSTQHTLQSLMGFLASPSSSDNVCNVPHRRALGLNSITSRANHLTDIPACYYRCHNTLTDHQTASSTVAPRVEGVVHLRHTRQGLRRFARELSCSVGSTARTSGASLL